MTSTDSLDPRSRAFRGSASITIGAVLLIGLVVVVMTFRDYGITWDESVQARYGEMTVDYFASGFQDRSYADFHDLRYYGAAFEALAALVYRGLGTSPFETRHFLTALCGLLTVLAAMLYGRMWRDPWLPGLAALALIAMPRFYGHAFNNSKDVPFACCFAWAMLCLAWSVTAPTMRWRHIVATAVTVGLTLSIRVGGVLLIGYVLAALFLRWLVDGRPLPTVSMRSSTATAGRVAGWIGIAWIVMVAGWPWAHENPLTHPYVALRTALDFPANKELLLAGRFVMSTDLPWGYLVRYLAITLPLGCLVLGVVGAIRVGRDLASRSDARESLAGALALLWFAFPLVYVTIARPTVYGGMRHFLFVLPALALLAALGAAWIRRSGGRGIVRAGWTVAVLIVLAWPLRHHVALHPYQTSYFNAVVGGVAGANDRYDLELLASSYKEVGAWITAQAAAKQRPLRVLVGGTDRAAMCLQYFVPQTVQFRMVNERGIPGELPDYADYYVAINRRHYHKNFPEAPVLHTVEREGAPLAVIKGHESANALPGAPDLP